MSVAVLYTESSESDNVHDSGRADRYVSGPAPSDSPPHSGLADLRLKVLLFWHIQSTKNVKLLGVTRQPAMQLLHLLTAR